MAHKKRHKLRLHLHNEERKRKSTTRKKVSSLKTFTAKCISAAHTESKENRSSPTKFINFMNFFT